MNRNTYKVWHAMHKRCTNPRYANYANYGGRGISVCDEWASFHRFVQDMGEKPAGMQLDRIDNNGRYEPANCRWASAAENTRNRRNTVVLEYDGRSQCLADWAAEVGMSRQKLAKRLALGWSVERALTAGQYERMAA